MFHARADSDRSMTRLGLVSKQCRHGTGVNPCSAQGAPAPRHKCPGGTPAHRTAFYLNIASRQGSVNAAEVQCSGIAMAAAGRGCVVAVRRGGRASACLILRCPPKGGRYSNDNTPPCGMASASIHVI